MILCISGVIFNLVWFSKWSESTEGECWCSAQTVKEGWVRQNLLWGWSSSSTASAMLLTPRLWPIDCLSEKSEFGRRKSGSDWKVNTAWSWCCRRLRHPFTPGLNSPRCVSVCPYDSTHTSLWSDLLCVCELLFLHSSYFSWFCTTDSPTVRRRCDDDWMLKWAEMRCLHSPHPPPPPLLLSSAIFPLDGLVSNPQTLCTCVSISTVAWRPFCCPKPERFSLHPLHWGDQVNIILVREKTFLIYWKAA